MKMMVIDGLTGIVELIEGQKREAADALERGISKKTEAARLRGQVEMATAIIAYITGDVKLIVTDKATGNRVIAR